MPAPPPVEAVTLKAEAAIALHPPAGGRAGAARLDAFVTDAEGVPAAALRYRRVPAGSGLPPADYCDGVVTPREWFELAVGEPAPGADSYRLDRARWVFDRIDQAEASREVVTSAVRDLREALAALADDPL